ncbi:MAG: hypothetical protein JO288_17585 [Hyphomicrobiales bacterium]|nr:hypothetical protein [Hyphomicrobiales bacterium]
MDKKPPPLDQRKRIAADVLKRLGEFIHDESGSYLVFVSVLAPTLIGVAALGGEGAFVLATHRAVQAAADSAAVSVASYYAAQTTAVASPTSSQLTSQAEAVAASYGFVSGSGGASVTVNNPPSAGNFTGANCTGSNNCAFEVIVSQSHSPLLSALYLSNAMTISARAVALINVANGSGAVCVLALGKSSGGTANLANAITGAGAAPLNLIGCSVTTNSSDTNSITLSGSAHINLLLGGRASTVGNYSYSGTASVESCTSLSGSTCNGATQSPPPTGVGATPDPYADVTIPSATLSSCSNLSSLVSPWSSSYMCVAGDNTRGLCFSKNSTNLTLSPGTYCGGISISKGNATYTLKSGVYTLASTNNSQGLVESGGSNIIDGTAGVTLAFTSADGTYPPASSPMMDVPGSLTVKLTAPTSGSTAGFVIMGDRSMPLGTAGENVSPVGSQFRIQNGATATLDGAVYLPNGALTLDGNGFAATNCSQIVTNVLDLDNSGTMTINCAPGDGGSAPSSLIGMVPLLVE